MAAVEIPNWSKVTQNRSNVLQVAYEPSWTYTSLEQLKLQVKKKREGTADVITNESQVFCPI